MTMDEARKIVEGRYPDDNVQPVWTSHGWRLVVAFRTGDCTEIGRTESGYVPEDEVWIDAAEKIQREAEQGL